MQIGTSLNIAAKRAPKDVMPRLAAAGFEVLDLNFYDHYTRFEDKSDRAVDAWLDELAEAAGRVGLAWVQAHGPYARLLPEEKNDPAALATIPAAIRACGRLHIPWLVLHPGTLPGGWDASHRKAMVDANAAALRPLLEQADQAGVGLAIENMPPKPYVQKIFGGTPEDLHQILDAVNHPRLGVCWDAGHARMMQLEQKAAIASLGGRLKAIHVQDNNGKGDDHMLPFSCWGGVSWSAVTAGLRQAGYAGAFTYEAPASFASVPEELYDTMLARAVLIARHIVEKEGV